MLTGNFLLVSCLLSITSTLKMETVHSPETYKLLQEYVCHVPDHNILNNDRCENLKSSKKRYTIPWNVRSHSFTDWIPELSPSSWQ
jgi:hypothetical protein